MRVTRLKLALGLSYTKIINSIAFYPALIAAGMVILSFLTMAIEYQPFMLEIKQHLTAVLVKSQEDARLILSTLVASIISLTVFSFSMVMIVLNRAAAQLSPRVVPGLITSKSNQVVLGSYIGTILFSLLLVVSIQADSEKYYIPSFGVFMAMLMAIYCLALFVYFIHTISQSIHADTILTRIYKSTHRVMDSLSTEEEGAQVEIPDTHGWGSISAKTVGYLKSVRYKELVHICKKHDLRIRIREQVGFFSIGEYPCLDVDKDIDEETEKAIHDCILFYPEDYVSDHYAFGLKQISEIAVKAMSPGINDPGTAVKAIDLLSVLLLKKMTITERNCYYDDQGTARVYSPEFPLEQLFYDNLTPIRAYAKQDAVVMFNLLESLRNLLSSRSSAKHRSLLCLYVRSIRDSCQAHINNELDTDRVNGIIMEINKHLDGGECVELITAAGEGQGA